MRISILVDCSACNCHILYLADKDDGGIDLLIQIFTEINRFSWKFRGGFWGSPHVFELSSGGQTGVSHQAKEDTINSHDSGENGEKIKRKEDFQLPVSQEEAIVGHCRTQTRRSDHKEEQGDQQ